MHRSQRLLHTSWAPTGPKLLAEWLCCQYLLPVVLLSGVCRAGQFLLVGLSSHSSFWGVFSGWQCEGETLLQYIMCDIYDVGICAQHYCYLLCSLQCLLLSEVICLLEVLPL